MSRSEPRTIARRLAACLDQPLWEGTEPPRAPGGILLTTQDALAGLPASSVDQATALVVVGDPQAATSAGLAALRHAVATRGAAIVLATFATAPGADGTPTEVPLVVAAGPDDERVAALLAAGPHALTLDPTVDAGPDSLTHPPARVCVVSFEVSGMTGGGIGTASTSLAEALAAAGHDVTLLFTGWQERDAGERNEQWRAHYAEREVRLAFVREPGTTTVKNPHFPARSAYEVYCWLRREEPFDVVHLPENMGHGAYAQLAKRQRLRFTDTTFVIGTHGPTRWAAEANRVALTREEFLVNDALERVSVAHADVLLGPSRYLHDYMRVRGWQLPERVHVQPYATPSAVRAAGDASPPAAPSPLPRELVFFGRIETRKGVALLCDALDLLAGDADLPTFEVTFLGPIAQVLGESADRYIAARAEAWPWPWQIVSDRDQQQAAEFLRRPGVLAIMPSLVDNAPNTVSEAVALGIPLVAGRTGGTGELVAADQRDDHMFGAPPGAPLLPLSLRDEVPPPDPAPLAELLRRRLMTPVTPARPAAEPAAVDAAYDRWHRAVGAARPDADAGQAVPLAQSLPSLSACLLFTGDEALLAEQLDALAGSDVEVVVADLRTSAEGRIAAAEASGVPIVRPATPAHAGEARAAAAAATSGELMVIVPANDVPLSAFAEGFGRAAATGADVYGCATLDEIDPPPAGDSVDAMPRAFVPLPGPPLAGLTHPAFATGTYAIRRTALERLGGYAADARGDEADHELLNRAAVAGLRLEAIPEPLAAKRRADRWSTFRAAWPHEAIEPPYDAEQWLRIERPFADDARTTGDLVGLLRGARTEAVRFQGDLHHQHEVYEQRFAEQRTWIDNLEAEATALRAQAAELAAKLPRAVVRRALRSVRDTATRRHRD